SVRIGLAGLVLASQPSPGKRAERRESKAAIGAERQDLELGYAVKQAVRILHPLEARPLASFTDRQRESEPPGFDVAGTDVEHLAGADEIVHRAKCLIEWCVGIGLVNQIHVQPIRAQP